ncbi:hypothetical protein ACNI3Q_01655 [Sphingomonas sp. FW199]|uniref:hypothetical protein n=1 Tax=Sphingomonas sp. FW199 TaxID=3400217 RepID=UPI003CE67310
MLEFKDPIEAPKLLVKAVRWAKKHRFHILSLSALAPSQSYDELKQVAKTWQANGFGTMFEECFDCHRTVTFSLNASAMAAAENIERKSLRGRFSALPLGKGAWDVAKILGAAAAGWLAKSYSG